MTLMGPNYSTVQEQLRIMKSGTEQEKSKITPDSIRDIRAYIEQERKVSGRNYSLEGEFKEWEDLAKNYESEKGTIQANTANATANTAATVEGNKQEVVFDAEKIKSLKINLEKEALSPINPTELSKILNKLKDEKDPNSRAIITSYVWSKLNNKGYIVSIENDTLSVQNQKDREGATLVEKTLQSYIKETILAMTDMQRAMMVGPTSFGKYLETQKVNPKNASTEGYVQFLTEARGIDLSKGKTPEQKIRMIQNSQATPEEKAVLISYINGGLKNYNISPEIERQIQIAKIGEEIRVSPAMKQAVRTVEVASGGGIKAEKQKMKDIGEEELTWNTFINNPMKAVTKYPWTSLGLVLGSIWKFGFMKTLLGLAGGVIGYNVADEWGLIDKMKKKEVSKEPEKSINSPKKKLKTSVDIPTAKSIDKQGLAGSRLAATERVEKDPHISGMIEVVRKSQTQKGGVETGDIADYISFINNELQNRKASEVVSPNDFKFSMFSDERMFDRAGKNNLDPMMLKRVLRIYLGVDMRLSVTQGQVTGKKEQEEFVGKYKSVFDNQNSTFEDLVDNIK